MIYNLLIVIGLLAALPKWLMQAKYKGTLRQRLGLELPQAPSGEKVIWVHMVSLGETRAMIPLIEELRKRAPHTQFYYSSMTKTGHEEAKRSLPKGNAYFYLPVDLSWIMRKFVARLCPHLLLISESDLWLNLMREVKKQGGTVALVNGKISEKSTKRFLKIPSRKLFDQIDHYLVQNSTYASRFWALGVPKTRVTVTGNLKLSITPPLLSQEEKELFCKKWGIAKTDQILTIASTHDREEELLIPRIPAHFRILLAPRHPERFESLKVRYGFDPRVIFIDEMGVLSSCFQVSEVAVIGGSFLPGVGGHNIFEPVQVGTPVVFGPFMESQEDLVSLIQREKAGVQSPVETLDRAIERAQLLKENTQQAAAKGRGALEKTVKALDLNHLLR